MASESYYKSGVNVNVGGPSNVPLGDHELAYNRDHYYAQASHTRRRRTHSRSHNEIQNHGLNMNSHSNSHGSPRNMSTAPNVNVNVNSNIIGNGNNANVNRKGSPRNKANRPRHRRYRNHLNNNDQEPTFSTTISDLIYILCGYTSRFLCYCKQSAPRLLRNLALASLLAITAFAAMMVVIILRFIHMDVTPLCTPPSWEQQQQMDLHQGPPLVEYYVHGRGNGHYARSVAIVETLLSKGVDVRMFIGRATMWRAVNAAHGGDEQIKDTDHIQPGPGPEPGPGHNQGFDVNLKGEETNVTRGQVTVTSVASLLPSMSIMDSLSLLIERVMSDCEIAKNTNRYPVLVISDGDLPGMWRAKYGSIPSVSIAHGQTFVIGHEPEWVSNNSVLKQAWKEQRRLNARTSWDANWMIATNFVDIPVDGGNGVVVRSPMRPEVIRMGRERQVRNQQLKFMNQEGDVLQGRGKVAVPVGDNFMESWQSDRLNALLFGNEVMEAFKIVRTAIETKQIGPLVGTDLNLKRRKLVICYFRDKNGDLLTKALLRSGFDVLIFERGYHKGISDKDGEKKFGQNLMVHREPNHHVPEGDEEPSLEDYWEKMLSQNDRKLYEDDEDEEIPMTKKRTGSFVDSQLKPVNDTSITSQATLSADENNPQKLQNAIETINELLKSDVNAPQIIRVTDMSLFVPLLSIADGVASSAGSQLLSECIYSHLNVLALHREDDTEQRLNIAFSKHRFDRLSKEVSQGVKQSGTLSAENIGHYADENVVHGMSQEKFANVFETISRHEEAKDEFETILTDAEEAMLLRTPESKQTYSDFKAYVEAVRQSPVSWSYYHDLFFGMTDNEEQVGEKEEAREIKEDGEAEYIDPFQGMPEAASVILEIIDDLTNKAPEK